MQNESVLFTRDKLNLFSTIIPIRIIILCTVCAILLFEEDVFIRFLNGWLPYCVFFVIIKLQFDKMPRPSFHTGCDQLYFKLFYSFISQ